MSPALALLFVVAPRESTTLTMKVDGVDRTAIVYAAPGSKPAPLVFAFHGHGGTAGAVARRFDFQTLWPEATVIYPQGLATKTARDPAGSKPGWQNGFGLDGDRDLKFFDAMLEWAKQAQHVDEDRVYVMGHSNGGGFTFVLWHERQSALAAVAPAAAVLGLRMRDVKPMPAMMISGEKDTTVAYDSQVRTATALRKLFGVEAEPTKADGMFKSWVGKGGLEFATYVYPGTHAYPAAASALIVDFFKRHKRGQ